MGSHDDSKVTKKEKGAKKFFTLMESIVEKNKTATYKIASIGDGREYITTSWKHNLGKYFEQIGVTGKIEYYKNDNFYYEQEPKPLQAVRTSRKSIEKHEETMKELLLSPNFLKSAIVELIISPLSSELLDVYNDFDPEVMANNKSKQKIINTAREKLTEYACAVKIHRRPVKEKSLIYKRVVIDMFLWQWQKNSTPKPFLTYDCNTVDELDMDCLRKFFDTLQSISRRNVKNVKYQLFLDPPSDDAYDPKFTNFIANLKGYMEMSGLQQPIITKVTY
jgi:hypothetical protein